MGVSKPVAGETAEVAVLTRTAEGLGQLATQFAGATAPASPDDWQRWADIMSGLVKRWDPNSDAWVVEGALAANTGLQEIPVYRGVLDSVGLTLVLPVPRQARVIESVTLVPNLAVSGDEDVYEFQLVNTTQTEDLFSDVATTDNVVSGVGGGPFVAGAPYVLTANQNANVAAGDVLELQITTDGSVPTVSSFYAQVNSYPRG